MSKAMLILDMPESCENCPFSQDVGNKQTTGCKFDSRSINRGKPIPRWCPLLPLDMQRMNAILRAIGNPTELYKIGL